MDRMGIDVVVSIDYKGKGITFNFKDNGRIGVVLVNNHISPHERYTFESTIKQNPIFQKYVDDFISNKKSYILSYRGPSVFADYFKN